MYLEMKPLDFIEDLRNILLNTKKGIQSLKDTYNYDTTLSSKLEMDINLIKRQIKNIENILKENDREIEIENNQINNEFNE